MKQFLTLLLFSLISISAMGEELPKYIPKVREHYPTSEKLMNFGAVYVAQWTYYLIGQREQLDDHGSYENWAKNPFSPHFDKDSFDYNIFAHSFTGNYYYLWYRSRGYTEQNAFIWTFLSSAAFEFTVETATERPSWQDLYQTPVFGTVLGIGFEKLSRYLHSQETWWGNTLGYILNPFTLIPQTKEREVTFMPILDQKVQGMALTYRY